MPGLKFRVLLDSKSDKEVFRDIAIDNQENFETFYQTIISAFDLDNNQMASFFVSDDDWNKGEEITLMDMGFDEGNPPEIMAENLMADFVQTTSQKFILVYDFLNMWIFLIELQDVLKEEVDSPKVLMKVGDVPDEMRSNSSEQINEINFDTEKSSDFGDWDDEFDDSDFENIDDLDI